MLLFELHISEKKILVSVDPVATWQPEGNGCKIVYPNGNQLIVDESFDKIQSMLQAAANRQAPIAVDPRLLRG